MALKISEEIQNQKCKLVLQGEITVATAPQLDEAIRKHIDDIDELVLDLDECDYTSSAGIRVLMSAYKKLHAKEGKFRLIHVGEAIYAVLVCTNLDSLFEIEKK